MPPGNVDNPWWMRIQAVAEPRARLFCFPFAGGSAGLFRPWIGRLPPTVEMSALQLPGRENRLREPPLRRMTEAVEALTAALLPMLDRPFCFFGYSLGGLAAFETVRRLRRLGAPLPARLLIAAAEAPHCEHARTPPVHRLSDADFVAELRRFKGTPEIVLQTPELLGALVPMLRADFEMLETYVAADEPPPAVPIAAYGGAADDEVPPDKLAAWSEATSGGFSMQFFPGDHFFLKTSLDPLLAAVGRELESVR